MEFSKEIPCVRRSSIYSFLFLSSPFCFLHSHNDQAKIRCIRDCGEMVRIQRCVLIDGIAAKKFIGLLLLVPFLVSHVLFGSIFSLVA